MKLKNFNDYEIDVENGTVWSYKSNRFVGYPNRQGYWKVTLTDDDGEQHKFYLHRLVWMAVHGEIPEDMEINHLDEDPSNCAIWNLSACSHLENIRYGTRTARAVANTDYQTIAEKLSKQVGAYRDGVLVMVFQSTREAGRNGFDHGAVSACCNGKLKTHKGYQWIYFEDSPPLFY